MSTDDLLGEFSEGMSADERKVRSEAFRLLLGGAAVGLDELAANTAMARGTVEALVAKLEVQGLVRRDRKRNVVVASWGVSVVPTNFRMSFDGIQLYGWCAEDVIGIPGALGKSAVAESTCVECGAPVRVDIAEGKLERATPSAVQVWIGEAELGSLMEAT